MKALVGAVLIDGSGSDPVADSAVLIDGDRIEAAGQRAAVAVPPDAEVLDLSGLTLLPGLIDCHDHLSEMTYSFYSRWRLSMPTTLQRLRTAKVLEDTLRSGFTCIRDGWGLDAGFKQAVEEGLIHGPRLVLSVSFISGTGGHADRVTPSGHRNAFNWDPMLPDGVADGPDQVRAKVREMIRAGADVIKFATTGGGASRPGLNPHDATYGRDEADALVAEAAARGRRTMCHAVGGAGLRMAVEAGAGSIEHGGYLADDPDLAKMMAGKGIFYVPTFYVYTLHAEHSPPHMAERAKALMDVHRESLHVAMAAGVRVAMGTDAGGFIHGTNAKELEILVQRGMTPMQAIQASTSTAAECVGLDHDTGTVAPGKLADLVAVSGDPLREIAILSDRDRIRLVMKGGEEVVNRLGEAADD